MKKQLLTLSFLLSLVWLVSCSNQQEMTAGTEKPTPPPTQSQPKRWYTQVQVNRGNNLFQENCAVCHKPDASGTTNWRELDANGKLPPPPLNGTAHTWHHPLSILRRTIRMGGIPLGGTMPEFEEKLTNKQIDDILAWVQSHWPDEIYRIWDERDSQAKNRLQPIKKG
ncbi:MAG: cytochrome c [Candidatus Thiodiazotropha sp. (ex. Lucinoma kazani)]